MKLKHLKALCKTLEDYENKCGDAEIDFVIDGKVYTPATFECNLDDRGNVWGLVINLELEEKLFMKLQILFLQNQNVKLLKNI